MKTTLEQQIAELTAKHDLQNKIESALPNIGCKIYTNEFNYKKNDTKFTFTVYMDALPLDAIEGKIKEVIAAFPPTKNNVLTFSSRNDLLTASPFVLRFKNGVRDHKAQIDYNSGEYWIHIELPIPFFSNDVISQYYRGVSDCEHHYFGGVSMDRINKMQLPACKLASFEVIKYYGGDSTSYITDATKKAEFETIVLTGKKPI